jgi:hypothetical protein
MPTSWTLRRRKEIFSKQSINGFGQFILETGNGKEKSVNLLI